MEKMRERKRKSWKAKGMRKTDLMFQHIHTRTVKKNKELNMNYLVKIAATNHGIILVTSGFPK